MDWFYGFIATDNGGDGMRAKSESSACRVGRIDCIGGQPEL